MPNMVVGCGPGVSHRWRSGCSPAFLWSRVPREKQQRVGCAPPSLGRPRAGVLEESTHRLCLPKPCWKGWGTLLLHGVLGSAVASAGAEGSGGSKLQQERSAQEG